MKLFFILLGTLLLLGGCSSKKISTTKHKTSKKSSYSKKIKTDNWINAALSKEYAKWDSTPYKYGGTSLRGVDCSSLMQIIYRDAFGVKIPRTTKEQAKIGYQVKKKSAREGDLVFFKTGRSTRHSGILISNGKFIHSSTKHGVIISSLNNPYWKSKYWQTRRVLP
ncbi:MAG: NlpC/P60 family protein [Campylobacterota bacterium]|nr:NlpC/P60 family protein [Campylobacterota bacterium]